jgi:gamma-glutamyltranspeptidase/glutathione hydrolase
MATEAGRRALKQGGNAVDAALAAAAMLAVVYPHQCSPGGDLFAVMSTPGGRLVAVNGSGAAPLGTDPEALRSRGEKMPARGPSTITVPGVMAAWETIAGLGARLGLAGALAPAATAAADGVPTAPGLARAIRGLAPVLAGDQGMAQVFLPDGEALAEGSTLVQPALARTLEAVSHGGVEALYRGQIGERMVSGLRALGSPMTREDLVVHQTQVLRPLSGRYRERDILTAPPNSQGFVLLQILAALERIDPAPDPLGSSAGAFAELFKMTSGDRDQWLCDPRRTRVPLDELLGQEHTEELARRARVAIADVAKGEGLPRAGREEGAGARGSPEPSGPPPPSGDTVAVVAMDADGHAVSLIQSVFDTFGSGILEPSTGLILHNRGTLFSLDPSHPATLEGGVRPPHTLTPVLVLDRAGRVEAAVGTMGGRAQPQILAQVVVRLLDHGVSPEVAVSAPRWIVGGSSPDIGPGAVLAEPAAAAALDMGSALPRSRIGVVGEAGEETGHAQAVVVGETELTAGSDPRADGAAAAG